MSSTPDAMLIVESGMPDVDHIPLTDDICVLLKRPDADLDIDNPFVSRRHCRIRFQDQSFYVSDLGSKNGTYVNGARLHSSGEKTLNDGDVIGLAAGQVTLRFRPRFSETDLPPSSLAPGLRVDSGQREVYTEGEPLVSPLSRKEFDVIELLYQHRGDAVYRDNINVFPYNQRYPGMTRL